MNIFKKSRWGHFFYCNSLLFFVFCLLFFHGSRSLAKRATLLDEGGGMSHSCMFTSLPDGCHSNKKKCLKRYS